MIANDEYQGEDAYEVALQTLIQDNRGVSDLLIESLANNYLDNHPNASSDKVINHVQNLLNNQTKHPSAVGGFHRPPRHHPPLRPNRPRLSASRPRRRFNPYQFASNRFQQRGPLPAQRPPGPQQGPQAPSPRQQLRFLVGHKEQQYEPPYGPLDQLFINNPGVPQSEVLAAFNQADQSMPQASVEEKCAQVQFLLDQQKGKQ